MFTSLKPMMPLMEPIAYPFLWLASPAFVRWLLMFAEAKQQVLALVRVDQLIAGAPPLPLPLDAG